MAAFFYVSKVDSASSSDVGSSCADSECRNVGRAGGAAAPAAARSGRHLLSPARQHLPGSPSNSALVSLPEVVEAAAAAAAASAYWRPTTPEYVVAASLSPFPTMFGKNKSTRSCSRSRPDASITPHADHPVCNDYITPKQKKILFIIFILCIYTYNVLILILFPNGVNNFEYFKIKADVPDCVSLDPLNEDSLLANLLSRFKRDQIYVCILMR